jgi:hypothetical protein
MPGSNGHPGYSSRFDIRERPFPDHGKSPKSSQSRSRSRSPSLSPRTIATKQLKQYESELSDIESKQRDRIRSLLKGTGNNNPTEEEIDRAVSEEDDKDKEETSDNNDYRPQTTFQLKRDLIQAIKAHKGNAPAMEAAAIERDRIKAIEKDPRTPQDFLCPLTKKIMRDPVIYDDVTYERKAIEKQRRSGSITFKSPIPNTALKNIIQLYLDGALITPPKTKGGNRKTIKTKRRH